MTNEIEEAKKAWGIHNRAKSAFDYAKAPQQRIHDAAYTQDVSFHSRQYGIEDYQSALRSAIEITR